jgi:nucleotide-binding universal stress UspA family protein
VEVLGPGADYIVLHVIEPPLPALSGRTGDPAVLQQLAASSERLSHRALAAAAEAVGGTPRRLQVRSLDAGSAICETAEQHDVDVVVVGTRGAGGIRRALLGSTSLHVVNHARRPVLVMGEDSDEEAA